MSSFVHIRLDTTPPSLEASLVEVGGTATLTLDTDDATEVKIWGDIDVTWPGNADFAEHENDAVWIPYDETFTVHLDPGGAKRLRVRARDDVWNESAAVLAIGEPGEPPVEPERPTRPVPIRDPRPAKRKRSNVRLIEDESFVHVHVDYDITTRTGTDEPITIEEIERVRVALRDDSVVATAVSDLVESLMAGDTAISVHTTDTIERRSEGPETEAAIVALGLL